MVNMYAQYIFCIVTFQMGDRDLHANCKVTNHALLHAVTISHTPLAYFPQHNHNPEIFVVLMVEQCSKDLKYKINIYISILLLTC